MNRRRVLRVLLALALLTPGWGAVQVGLQAQAAAAPAATAAPEAAPAREGQAAPAREPAQPPDGAAPKAAPEDDPWGFEDEPQEEQKAETWQDILRPQLFDTAMTIGFLAIALVSFFLKSKPLKYATLVLSVGYLGVMKSQLVSVTDLFRLVDMSFPTARDGVNWYIFTGFTVVSTVLFGRVYCGRICAFGAFTQLMDAVLPKRLRVEPPKWLEKRASYVKYGLLVATVGYYVATKHFTVYRYVEPFWMYTRTADAVLWTMLGALLLATVVVRNMYCRFLCPVGATLGLISFATVFGIKRWSECSSCKICEKTCEWGAIEGPKILKSECVRCDDCERVYADQKKCPHWLIPIMRQKKVAAALAAGRPAPQFIPLDKVMR